MELTPTSTTITQDTDTETPPQTRHPKSISFTNGKLKRHHHSPPPPTAVFYKECLKNHAASLGGLALDGCGEFFPSPSATPTNPTSLKCAACGCHRNFHRRQPEEPISHFLNLSRSTSPPSPPPVPQSFYASGPHMLLALRTGYSAPASENPNGRKRSRTKFSQEQKEKMCLFAEKVGWKMGKSDEKLVEEFCNEINVGKSVLKIWMHNNKHKIGGNSIIDQNLNGNGNGNNGDCDHVHVSTNGSSSTS